MSGDITNNFSHIRFGSHGESIFYKLNGKEYELCSTWVDGKRIHIDDLTKTNLDENQKTKVFVEIIQFVNQKDNEKPIICYNSDYADSELWNKLKTKLN